MTTPLFLGAYWKARRESIDECADRLMRFLVALSSCDEVLTNWFEKGRSRKQALQKQVDIQNRDQLLKLLDRGRNKRDIGGTVIDELGFSVDLWNGKDSAMGILCGAYASYVSNSVTFHLPEDLGDLRQPERMTSVLVAVVEAWEPDWAGVMSRDAMNARGFNARVPFVDWMLYLSGRLGSKIPALPRPATVQPVGELGSIIMVQGEPPDSAGPEQLENVQRVKVALKL
jgi:hypothetical protein